MRPGPIAAPEFSPDPPPELSTFHRILREQARQRPDAPAVLDVGTQPLTHADLEEQAIRLRARLLAEGIPAGARVALVTGGGAPGHVATLATAASFAAAPLRPTLTRPEAEALLPRLAPQALLVEAGLESEVPGVATDLDVPVLELHRHAGGAAGALEQEGPRKSFEADPPEPAPEDVALILPTSGSTAAPRLVPFTQAGLAAIAWGTSRALGLTPDDRSLCFMDPLHVHGLISCVLVPLIAGGSVACVGAFDPDRFPDWLRDLEPTWYSTSPAIHEMVLGLARRAPEEIRGHRLRFVRSGASPLREEAHVELEERLGIPLLVAYGMTELPNVSGNPPEKRRLGTVGRSAGAEIAVLGDDGTPLPPGSRGQVAVRGPGLTPGYLDDPAVWAAARKQEWFLTGDLGELDDDGFLHLRGRSKEQVNRGGNEISPAEVDEALQQIAGVEAALAFALPHPVLGQDLAAAVVEETPGTLEETGVLRELRRRLDPSKIPTRVLFVEALPTTPSGKPSRRQLQERLADQVAEEADDTPATPGEVRVAEVWKEVLGLPRPGRLQDFFTLGGTSLHAVQVAQRLEADLGVPVHVPLLFERRTVRDLAAWIEERYPGVLERAPEGAHPVGATREVPDAAVGLAVFRAQLADRPWEARVPAVSRNPGAVFLLSAPRSGSTLLRVMLAGHPDLFAPPELRLLHFETLRGWWQAHQGAAAFRREGVIRALMQLGELDFQDADAELRAAVDEGRSVQGWLGDLQRRLGDRRLVDKSPHYALDSDALERMEDWFEEPRFLHLTRGPEASVHSWMRAGMDQIWGGPEALPPELTAEMIWAESQRNLLELEGRVPPERWRRVRFEDLVTDPDGVMTEIAEFLEVPDLPCLRTPYDDASTRMTDPARPGSRALGDPRFDTHQGIEPESTRDWVREFDFVRIGGATWRVAEELGYHCEQTVPVRERMFSVVRSWRGTRRSPDGLLVGRNLWGSRPPLFWCFQSEEELDALADQLGLDQPVWGLRSAHMVLPRDSRHLRALAALYTREILEAAPRGPYRLGGNCQGGRIAFDVALELMRLGRTVAGLVIMEAVVEQSYPGPVTLLFGEASEFNPNRSGVDPVGVARRYYGSVRSETIPGGHGEYFRPPHVAGLASILQQVMASD